MGAAIRPAPREWFRTFFDTGYLAGLVEETPPSRSRAEVDFIVKHLGLGAGARVLDVACGYGRHAALLARRGCRVVGVDLSPAMLAEARRRARGASGLRFVRGDMRRLDFRGEFDAVISVYTSFGYFTPAQNEAALRRMARALRPGGKLLVDHRDPAHDGALPRWLGYRVGPRRVVLEERRFDRRTKITETRQLVIVRGNRLAIEKRYRLQEYSLAGWRRLLRAAGLRLVGAYSGYDGRPFRAASTGQLIVVAERPPPLRSASAGPPARRRAGCRCSRTPCSRRCRRRRPCR